MNKKLKLLIPILAILVVFSGCSAKATTTKIATQTESSQTDNKEQNNEIETYFTKKDGNLDKLLIKEINTAQKSLDVAIYSITKDNIATAIIEAKKKGLDVKVITDKQESQSKYQKEILDKFKTNGIPIKINSHAGLMHLKISIIDGKTVTGGSYNYTDSATRNNDENLIIMRDTNIVSEYVNEYNEMWNDTSNYSLY